MSTITQRLVRKVHDINGSKVVTLHPDIVKKLALDELSFFEQETLEDGSGVIMRLRRLS